MKTSTADNTIHLKGALYEVYDTNNRVIRWLGERLVKAVCAELNQASQDKSCTGLDVGCGEGHMLKYLLSMGGAERAVGIDLDGSRLQKARSVVPRAAVALADIRSLPFSDGSFNYAIAAEVLEHIPAPEDAMREMMRVLKPGAGLIISVPMEPYFHWGNFLRGKHLGRFGRTPAHVNFWNRQEIQKFVSDWVSETRSRVVFPWLVLTGRKR